MTTKQLSTLMLAVGFTALAGAESSPYYIGASQSFVHYSNLLHLSEGQAAPAGFSKSDTISSTGLVAGFDQPIGRQRVFGDLNLHANRMQQNEIYDNESYSLDGGLDWSTVERVSGQIRASANRSLAQFNSSEIGLITRKNLQTTKDVDAVVRVGVVTALSAEASAGYRSIDYSAIEYEARTFHQDTYSLGMRYRPSSDSSFGLAFRDLQGEYPRFRALGDGSFQNDRFERRSLELTGAVEPSAISRFNAQLSFGKTNYDIATQRDFSGVTGFVAWNWVPTGKVQLNVQLSRAPGQDAHFFDKANIDDTIEFSRVTTTLRTRLNYALSSKVNLNATFTTAYRTLVRTLPSSSGGADTLSQRDRSNSLSFGATWAPTRTLVLGCNASNYQRSGDAPLSSDFRSTIYGCNGRFTLQP